MRPIFDEVDDALVKERFAKWNRRKGPRVGDFVILRDGSVRRFAYECEDSLQVTTGGSKGSFYFGDAGMNHSGGLDPAIPKKDLVELIENRQGECWVFHHDYRRAHNDVSTTVRCRVFQVGPIDDDDEPRHKIGGEP